MAARKRYVVAIGEYDPSSGQLNHEGKQAAKTAGKQLAGIVTKKSVVLGLDTPRHRKTANLIAKRLDGADKHIGEGIPQELWPVPNVGVDEMTTIFREHLQGTSSDGMPAILTATPELVASVLNEDPGKITGGAVYSFDPQKGLKPLE